MLVGGIGTLGLGLEEFSFKGVHESKNDDNKHTPPGCAGDLVSIYL